LAYLDNKSTEEKKNGDGGNEDDRKTLIRALNGMKEMNRRFQKMLENEEEDAEELKRKIDNLDRMIEKTIMQIEELDNQPPNSK
jgi:predicted RNase H-like nuclease (RuvC/YqgF family)